MTNDAVDEDAFALESSASTGATSLSTANGSSCDEAMLDIESQTLKSKSSMLGNHEKTSWIVTQHRRQRIHVVEIGQAANGLSRIHSTHCTAHPAAIGITANRSGFRDLGCPQKTTLGTGCCMGQEELQRKPPFCNCLVPCANALLLAAGDSQWYDRNDRL
jgi:hypothetical protein